MTYRQVLEAGRRAVWDGTAAGFPGERFVHLPGGITYWESPRPGRRTYCCSLPAGERPFPADGWRHEQRCDCRFCAAERAAAA